jgi:hypothetical protein
MNYLITDFKVEKHEKELDSVAIQKAIDLCASNGGGKVTIPAGKYTCGSIIMKSNVTLYLEQGAILNALKDYNDFVDTGWKADLTDDGDLGEDGIPLACVFHKKSFFRKERRSFVFAKNVHDCSIEGNGIIDMGFSSPMDWSSFKGRRIQTIYMRDSCNVKITGISLHFAENWAMHLINIEDLEISNLTIKNCRERITTDGIDIDGCRRVVISGCNISVGDDAIVLRSSEGHLCENIVVTNCIITTTCVGLMIGICALGDIRNVTFSNCCLYNTSHPIDIDCVDGSTYENISFSNIVMDKCGDLLISMYPQFEKEHQKGKIKNLSFTGLQYSGYGRIYMESIKDYPLENISFSGVNWEVIEEPERKNDNKSKTNKKSGYVHSTLPDEVFHQHSWQPALIVAAHVNGLQLANIQMSFSQDSGIYNKELLYLHDVENKNISEVKLIKT